MALRSLAFYLGYWILTIVYGTLSVICWLLPPRTRHRCVSSWTTLIIQWLKITCGVRYTVIGREHLEGGSEKIVLSKHQSAWETLFLQSLCWPAATVLKRELLRLPFFGWGLRALNPIAIDRSNPRQALRQVKQHGIQRLQQGMNIILFPEGTRMASGKRGKYARSGADIAVSTNRPVIPVAVNAGHCWPPKRFLKTPGEITVVLGAPILPSGKNSKEIMEAVENWIEDQMTALDSAH